MAVPLLVLGASDPSLCAWPLICSLQGRLTTSLVAEHLIASDVWISLAAKAAKWHIRRYLDPGSNEAHASVRARRRGTLMSFSQVRGFGDVGRQVCRPRWHIYLLEMLLGFLRHRLPALIDSTDL
jgi:hypothetical protein